MYVNTDMSDLTADNQLGGIIYLLVVAVEANALSKCVCRQDLFAVKAKGL